MQRTCFAAGAAAVALSCASAGHRPRTALELSSQVDHIDVSAREPMVVEHPNGTLFVAGYGQPHPTLWKSTDRGATWARVDVGTERDGAVGNSDVDLAMARDGTLYFASMLYDRPTNEGVQIAVGSSRDEGATWRWSTPSKTRFDDRPWIDVAPDGAAHVIWNDGAGVSHAVSRDRGETWSELPRIHDAGGSSHLAIGPGGEIAVRITPASASGNRFDAGVDLIAVSTDGGATWRKQAAPGTRDWAPDLDARGFTPRWVEPLAWDPQGRLYSLWTDKTAVRLASSADRGATWTAWIVARHDTLAFFPYLVATASGRLAATWFTASSEDLDDLTWQAARIEVGPRLTVRRSAARTLECRSRGKETGNDTGGEYLAIAALRDGSLGVVSPIQNPAAKRFGFTWWRFGP